MRCRLGEYLGPKQSMVLCHLGLLVLSLKQVILLDLCSWLQRMDMGLDKHLPICCKVGGFLDPKQSMVPCHHRLLGLRFKQVILLVLCSWLQRMDMGLDEH